MKRSAPLQRRTPLRAKTRLRAKGRVKGRWDAWRAECRAIVAARSAGLCEALPDWPLPTEWAHLFGRRGIVAEPWASSPALTMMMCHDCHDRYDGRILMDHEVDRIFRDRLRWKAIHRWLLALREDGIEIGDLATDDPLGAARMIERRLQRRLRVRSTHSRHSSAGRRRTSTRINTSTDASRCARYAPSGASSSACVFAN